MATKTNQPTVTRTKVVRCGRLQPVVKVHFPIVDRTITLFGPVGRNDDAIREAAGYLDRTDARIGQS